MPHDITTFPPKLPSRRWSRPYLVTLSDTVTDRNLWRDTKPYKYIQNVGTSGLVMIAWEPDAAEVSIYLAQGAVLEGGLWRHAKSTGTGAGVELRGFLGVEGRE